MIEDSANQAPTFLRITEENKKKDQAKSKMQNKVPPQHYDTKNPFIHTQTGMFRSSTRGAGTSALQDNATKKGDDSSSFGEDEMAITEEEDDSLRDTDSQNQMDSIEEQAKNLTIKVNPHKWMRGFTERLQHKNSTASSGQ